MVHFAAHAWPGGEGNLPASLLAAAQKRAIAIAHALPPTPNAAPLPLHSGDLVGAGRAPRARHAHRRARHAHRRAPPPPLKAAQRAREAAEVVGGVVRRRRARQHPPDRDHRRRVRAQQQRGRRAARRRVGRCQHGAERVRDPRVQRADRLAVRGGDYCGCVGAVEEVWEVRFERGEGCG